MLGLVLSLVVSTAPAMPSAAVTCPGWPATCDGAAIALVVAPVSGPDGDDTGPRDYATPVEVDCPTPLPGGGPIASGECENTPLDLWYRVSRRPEDEQPTGSLAPVPRHPRASRGSSCGGGPADPGHLTLSDLQPLALFAQRDVVPESIRGLRLRQTQTLPVRTLAPPDRPPRT